MRLVWNPSEKTFEAQLQDFQSDLAAVKSAGFRTTGPPEWKWFTTKIGPLDKLRKNRPASGLTILTDALAEYNRLKAEEDKKEALLAELKAAKKAVERASEKAALEEEKKLAIPEGQEFGYNVVPDILPKVREVFIRPAWTGPSCCVCNSPVYFYEKQEPPTCITCEAALDNEPELF